MSSSNERAVSRERNLRNASAELVKASGREQIYAAVLKAVLPFIEEAPGTRVSVWSGSAEQDHCVGAAGDRAEDIRGSVTYIRDFPDWLRMLLLNGEIAEIKPGQPGLFREAFGFETKLGAIFMVPLMVQDRFEGRIAVASDSELPGDIRYVLEVLASQTALALERTFLDEEVFRRRGDERFRKLVQNSSDVITVLETDGIIRYESPSVEQILGYKPEELTGQNVLDYVHPDDTEELLAAAARAIEQSEELISIEYRFAHKSGAWCYLESVADNLIDDSEIAGVVINSRDITARKQAEEELRKSEKRNRAIIQAYPDLMFRLSRDGEYLDYQANDSAELYIPREEIIGNDIRDTLPSDVAAGALRHLARTFETGTMQIYEYQLTAPEGLLDFEARFVATGGNEALCIIRDVTERKRVQAALHESEERFRTLFEHSVDALIVHDEAGRILDCNAEACRSLGYTREEILSLRVKDIATGRLLSEEERGEREEHGGTLWQRVMRGEPDTFGTVHYGVHKRKDGTTFPVEVHVGAVDYGGRRLILGSVRDITERREFEKRLQENEQRYRSLFQSNPDPVYELDREGRFISTNPAMKEISGYGNDGLAGTISGDYIVSEYRETAIQQFVLARKGEARTYETAITHKEGHRVEVAMSHLPIYVGGEIVGVYGIAKDITERKRAEDELRATGSRLSTLIESLQAGILVEDGARHIRHINQEFCDMFSIPAPPEALVGADCSNAAEESKHLFAEPEEFVMRIDELLAERRPVTGEELSLADGRTFERDYVPVYVGGEYMDHLWQYREITERKRAEAELRESETRFRTLFDQAAIGVCTADLDRRLTQTNAAYQKITGYTEEELVCMSTLELTHPDDRASDTGVHGTFVSDESDSYQREKRYLRKDGEVVWGRTTSTLVRDESREPSFIMGVVEDVTDRRRADEELREAVERFRSAFENTAVRMALVDDEGRYLQVNRAMRKILGYSEEEFLSTTYQDITYQDDHEKSMIYAQRIWEGETDSYSLEKRYLHAAGHPVWVNLSVSLVRNAEGGVLYYIAQVQDIHERKRAEAALLESEQRYRSLVDLSPDAVAVHSEDKVVYANAAAAELFGASSSEELIGRNALDFVHSDYREAVRARIARTLQDGEPAPLMEEKYIRLDGELLDVEVAGAPVRYLGKPSVQVVLRDVSERKRAEETIRESEERYRAVVERATDGIYIYEFHTKRILESNTALRDMLGYAPEELREMTIYDLIANERASIDRNTRRLEKEQSAFLGERDYLHKDGSIKVVESSATLIPYGGKDAACCIIRDFTERKVLQEQLSYQAFHDSLTGLPNRLLFTERLEHALARAGRQKNRVAVLLMDLDNFKDVNDSLGHDAGDQLLASVAKMLSEAVRPGDTVARFGGDELCVLLEEVADANEASWVAEHIKEVLQAPITVRRHEIFVSASIGIAVSRSPEDRSEDLVSRADLAMYGAKNSGKSRHEIFTPGMETAAKDRLQLGNDLRRAVESSEIKVYYQPKVYLGATLQQRLRSSGHPAIVAANDSNNQGLIVGMEALARWGHPERGIVRPQ